MIMPKPEMLFSSPRKLMLAEYQSSHIDGILETVLMVKEPP
jgi:hypothetical protein